MLQPFAVPTLPGANPGQILATIRFAIGDVEYTKQLILATTQLQKLTVPGSRVSVDLSVINATNPSNATIDVRVGATLASVRGADGYAWSWGAMASADIGQAPGNLSNQPGVLAQMHATMSVVPVGAGGTLVWMLLIDKATAPVGAEKPINGGVSDAFSAAGQNDEQNDELAPGGLAWSTQLWAVLSTTPDQYTKPAVGYAIRLDYKIGT